MSSDEVQTRNALDQSEGVDLDARASDPDPSHWIGRVLGERYRLTEVIGAGGFGFVFRAKHLVLGRDVAVKILQGHGAADSTTRARFERESSMLAALSHPNIVTVIDYGVDQDQPYLVMELVEGGSLRDLIERRELSFERSLRLTIQILKALQFAHERGIVHRDLKPTNILVQSLSGEDHIKLLDFGFAKFFGENRSKPGNTLTAHGMAFGTIGYVAPEQLSSTPIDGRADLYAVGVILFECIAGTRPFHHADRAQELRATVTDDAPALLNVAPNHPLIASIDPITRQALAKNPDDRPRTASEMLVALEDLLPARTSAIPLTQVSTPPPRVSKSPEPRPPPTPRKARTSGVRVLALSIGGAVALLIAAVTLAIAWNLRNTEEERAMAELAMDAASERSLSEPLLGPPTGDRPVPADPWQQDEVPPELEAIRSRIDAGETLERNDRGLLWRRIQEQPWDPRPLLLFAYAARADNSLTASIGFYERAYRAQPASRGDVRMLRDLVVMATHAAVQSRATEAIRTIYGSEALPAIDRAMEAASVDPRAQARLEAARARVLETEAP